jgi:hypothetical protein
LVEKTHLSDGLRGRGGGWEATREAVLASLVTTGVTFLGADGNITVVDKQSIKSYFGKR